MDSSLRRQKTWSDFMAMRWSWCRRVCKFVATDRPPTIAGPTRRIRVGNCARAIAVVTDANVGAGHADAVDTCRKVALRLRCAMNGRASCEQGCSLCKRLTKTIKGHPISRIDEVLSRRFAVRPPDQQ